MKAYDTQELCSRFAVEGRYISAIPYGEGHINDTYLINTTSSRYILQRVNKEVFKNPLDVMDNILLITDHLHNAIIARCGDPYRETLTLVPTREGERFYMTPQGDVFRMYIFIDHAICYQAVESPEIFYKIARAFGAFQKMLRDFPASKLKETIPDFHDTAKRYETFKRVLAADKLGRRAKVEDEVEFLLRREAEASVIMDALRSGEIPLRVTHNDTKLNNVMVDEESGEGICIIDLDTVMPGSMLFDFGDSIRFGASSAAEDETELAKVWMDLGLFEQYTKGYLEELGDAVTPKEAELLPFSAKLMTLECGMRFLTDYLDGDCYFHIHRPEHNLDRARTQLKLVADMESKMPEMEKIVEKYFQKRM